MTATAPSTDAILDSFAHPTVVPLVSKRTYLSISKLFQQCVENAASIPSTIGGGANGHAGQVLSNTRYLTISGNVAFTIPPNLGPTATIPANSTGPQIAALERAHKQQMSIYLTYRNVDAALKQQILAAVPKKYLKALYNRTTGFMGVTARQLLEHLQTQYGKLTPTQFKQNADRFAQPYDPNEPIEDLFERIEDAMDIAEEGGIAYTPQQVVKNAYNIMFGSGLFLDACRDWRRKAEADKTWETFQQHFTEAEEELRESQLTGAHIGAYQQANNATDENQENIDPDAVTKTADALMNLATATQADRKMLADLTAMNAVLMNTIATKDAEIQKLREATPPINPWKPPTNPWIKPTNKKEPKPRYCWTHGHTRKMGHTSSECKTPATGHKKEATATNTMGGNPQGKPE